MNTCPKCQSNRVAVGHLHGEFMASDAVFRPDGLKSFTFTIAGGVHPPTSIEACLDCGLLWGQVEKSELLHFIEKHCTKEAQAKCGLVAE